MTKPPAYLYRISAWRTAYADEWDHVYEGPIEGCVQQYLILKTTPKGYWIALDIFGDLFPRRFVLRGARRRYACETIPEALESFLARKKAHKRHLSAKIRDIEAQITYANKRWGNPDA